jgi:DNA-binding LacI/PurR family transcriptional regulator
VIGAEPPNVAGGFEYSVEPSDPVAWRRLTGYRQGLELGGVKLRDESIVAGPPTFDGGVAAFHRLWEDGLRPTAILAMSDSLALGVMWAARELGLYVPEDLSVVGFDDLEMALHSNPPLTTVHQPIRGKGEEAARLLLRMIASPDLERPEHKTLDTRLIIRASTALARPRNRAVPRLSRTGLERGALGR